MISLLVLLLGGGVVVVQTVSRIAQTHYLTEDGPDVPASYTTLPSLYSAED